MIMGVLTTHPRWLHALLMSVRRWNHSPFLSPSILLLKVLLEAIAAFQIKPASGWGWALFSGVITVLLGAMIWNQFPLSGAWAIGTLVGIKLLFSGWSLLMFGMVARSAEKA